MATPFRAALLTAMLSAPAVPAMAQTTPPPQAQAATPVMRDAPVSFGAEVAAVLGPKDDIAFFNYTDYEHDTMRMALVRLFGEWRIVRGLSVLGEFRTEDFDTADIAALYVRWRPSERHGFDIQAGRIPPVIGAFARRAYGRDNPLIAVPLGYQYLTSLRPDALPATVDDLLRMRARGWQPSYPIGSQTLAPGLPLVATSQWDTGVEARLRTGWWDLAGAWTRGSPADPVVKDTNLKRQWSGRVGVRLPSGLILGLSGARAQWPHEAVLQLLAPVARTASTQTIVGADAEYSHGAWLARGEWLRSTFGIPTFAGTPSTPLAAATAFAEVRWRFLPRWSVSGRVDRLSFSPITGTLFDGQPTSWDAPIHRVDVALSLRIVKSTEVRAGWQYDWRDGGRVKEGSVPALQVLWWF